MIQDGSLRRQREEWEKQTLSPYAMCAVDSRGRETPIPPCPVRTDFIRDRDRILHCKSFRRMKHKTQVFLSPTGDHYRTRLTHTLEVAQIARTISRALNLNEDLTEAIALGHDLGHTPFGHAGEDVLNALVPGGFEHNVQSLRVVERLENDGQGLNLTWEVRDGIVNHKRSGHPSTVEGKVVSYADRIAYLNHDIDDSIRAGVLKEEMIPSSCKRLFGDTHGKRINNLILNLVENSMGSPIIRFSDEFAEEFDVLRAFMFEHVYLNPAAKGEEVKAKALIKRLYEFYFDHPDQMPSDYRTILEEDGKGRAVADFLSGMTDTYAIRDYERIFVPSGWEGI